MIDHIEIRKEYLVAEGTGDENMYTLEVYSALEKKGYSVKWSEIWFDDMQKIWRFKADIQALPADSEKGVHQMNKSCPVCTESTMGETVKVQGKEYHKVCYREYVGLEKGEGEDNE